MAVTAQAGVFAFGPQASKGTITPSFHRHKAVNIDLGVQDDVRTGQLEIGGLPTPTFPYKAGYVIGGGASLQPRLEDTFGWLLYGALGKCTSTENPASSGMYDHKFEMAADATQVPWMSMRKYIPGLGGDLNTDLGETYKDLKVLGLAFQMGSDTPLNARLDSLGREFALDDAGDAWVYSAAYEDWESIPVACMTDGYIQVAGEELPVTQATFQWQNQPLDIRQEKVIGSPLLEDVTILTRQLSFDIIVKYNNPQLYRKVLTGSPTGTAWSGTPFTAALDIKTVSSVNMPTESEPYSLRCQATEVLLQQVGGIQLGAGQAVFMRFQGVALDTTGDYASFTLRNKKATYTWPT
jgi:hypothetical protein